MYNAANRRFQLLLHRWNEAFKVGMFGHFREIFGFLITNIIFDVTQNLSVVKSSSLRQKKEHKKYFEKTAAHFQSFGIFIPDSGSKYQS